MDTELAPHNFFFFLPSCSGQTRQTVGHDDVMLAQGISYKAVKIGPQCLVDMSNDSMLAHAPCTAQTLSSCHS